VPDIQYTIQVQQNCFDGKIHGCILANTPGIGFFWFWPDGLADTLPQHCIPGKKDNMQKQEILAIYEQAGALLSGHFILSSGRHSDRYLQSAKVLMHPAQAARLAGLLAAEVDADEVDLVVAPALGGLIIGHEVARALQKPFIFTERKEGVMTLRRGFDISEGARVLVVEDVITTGGSVRECMQVVRHYGGAPQRVMALVDRAPAATGRFNVPCQSLLQLEVPTYDADTCPLCAAGVAAVKPGSRPGAGR